MKISSYTSYRTNINFPAMVKQGWLDPRKKQPRPTCSRTVLVVVNKHGGDAEVNCVWWIPKDTYEDGDFVANPGINQYIIPLNDIYLWRDLDFLILED